MSAGPDPLEALLRADEREDVYEGLGYTKTLSETDEHEQRVERRRRERAARDAATRRGAKALLEALDAKDDRR